VQIDLDDDEAAALIRALDGLIRNDRYPLSPRIRVLRQILARLRPEPPAPPPRPLPKVYEPPSRGRYAKTGGQDHAPAGRAAGNRSRSGSPASPALLFWAIGLQTIDDSPTAAGAAPSSRNMPCSAPPPSSLLLLILSRCVNYRLPSALALLGHRPRRPRRARLIELKGWPPSPAEHEPMNRQQRRAAAARRGQARAIQQNRESPAYWGNFGLALHNLGRLEEAVAGYDRALALRPDLAEVYYNRGNALRHLDRLDAAIASYDSAIALKPDFAEAYVNRGVALQDLWRPNEALESYDHVLALKPDLAEALNNRGSILREFGRLDEALESCDRAIALKPDLAEALNNRGNILRDLGRFGLALESYERALAVRPDFPDALVGWIEEKRRLCDWSGAGEHEWKVRITSGLQASLRVVFTLLSLASPAEHLAYARRVAARFDAHPASFRPAAPRSGGRIRLGYLSADLRTHPVAFLIAGLIERHDRRRFEVLGYSCGPDDGSAIRARLTGAFDHFVDLRAASHRQAAELIHAAAVDILVDLTGYTELGRTAILAHRPAPIQVNYLGYPGTTGADFIDYIIVDGFVVPAVQQPFFSERLVHLPDCYQCNDDQRAISENTPSRAECGLPEQGFVFCCFNNVYKITPEFFDIWMRLLAAVPGSVLWLLDDNPWAKANLAREAAARGIGPDRLVFAPRMPLPDHLARHRLADLFLDTLPYNAHTTASDALWAGLPLLTCAGGSFAGRVAGSLLQAIGLPELVTDSLEEYEALARRLARDGERLAALRASLARNKSTHPLFDTGRFAGTIETAYRQMHETWQAGRPPSAFAVSATADN
jgi:predicted O-linked N-acetylglucosamine transferase (SPINDLY family)